MKDEDIFAASAHFERLGLPKAVPGQDVHKLAAARHFGVPYDEVTDAQRKWAKTVNFPLIYAGMP